MIDFDTTLREPSTTENRVGAAATALAVAGLGCTFLLPGLLFAGSSADVVGFAVGTTVTVALAGVLFGTVVPRTLRAPGETNRPAMTGLAISLFALVSLALHWLGVPLVIAAAGLVLGRRGRERADRSGRRGPASAAFAISAFVAVVTIAIVGNDVLGLFGLGLQPPE